MPKKLIKVKDNPDLVRDSHSKAIINTDRNNYANAKSRKKRLLAKDKELEDLRNDLEEMKKMLQQILNK